MDSFTEGLRCQDVTLGLRELSPLSTELRLVRSTQLVGQAADLAGLLRGRNIISNMDALDIVASETLEIPPSALPQVLAMLERYEMVELDRRNGQVVRVVEQVPIYGDLYASLGGAWRDSQPRQIEEELVAVVDRLSRGPVPLESLVSELGVDRADLDQVYRLGVDTSIFQTVESGDGTLLYSPYMAFENPSMMYHAFERHGSGILSEALGRINAYQGLPVSMTDPVLVDAVGLGLVSAPAVELPNGPMQPFATMPYAFDQSLTRDRKPVLEKALAIVACIRCGQNFGGNTHARDAVDVLDALRSRESLNPHSSHERQYKLLRDLGVIRFLPDSRPGGNWVRPSFIRTPENEEAVQIAISLIRGDEILTGREPDEGVKTLLGLDARAIKPLRATARTQVRHAVPPADLSAAFESIMGRGEL